MSERELREIADRYREQAHDIYSEDAVVALMEMYDDFGKALADDPDVVGILIALKQKRDESKQAWDEAKAKDGPLESLLRRLSATLGHLQHDFELGDVLDDQLDDYKEQICGLSRQSAVED